MEADTKPTTDILEALYLIRAQNKGEVSFMECMDKLLCWAKAVIAEDERAQADARSVNEDEGCQ